MKKYRPFCELFCTAGLTLSVATLFIWFLFCLTHDIETSLIAVTSTLIPFSGWIYMTLYGFNTCYIIGEDLVYYTDWLGRSSAYSYSAITKVEYVSRGRSADGYCFYVGNHIAFFISDTKTTEPLMRDMMRKIPVLVKAEFYTKYKYYDVDRFDRLPH